MKEHQNRFVGIVEYIEENLDSDLDIDKLCQLACLSKYHFHRQCSAFFGMSVMSIVKLLRLKRAAYQLAYRNNSKIVDIALATGYESHEAFTRAFKKRFNKSPSDFRLSPDWTPWQIHYEPIVKLRSKILNNKVDIEVSVVDFPEILIAIIEHRGSPNSLGATIKKFITWRQENRLPPSKNRTFNLIYDDPKMTAPEDYRFDICCSMRHEVEENIYGITSKVIPAGRCALVRHIGSDDSIGLVVDYLYSQWLSSSNFEIRDFPIFLERVTFFPEVAENEMITDIYLPIE